MTPIERVSEKSRAFAILGVPRECTKSDLKSAYRQLAREKHPDQESGSADEFSRITNAYQYLQENADEFGISDESVAKVAPRMARPTVRATESTFAEDILDECRAELETSDLEATMPAESEISIRAEPSSQSNTPWPSDGAADSAT